MAESQDALTGIQSAGFLIDGDDIYFPISLDAETLAKGFENDDLAEATKVFEDAAKALDRATPHFDQLHSKIVEAVG